MRKIVDSVKKEDGLLYCPCGELLSLNTHDYRVVRHKDTRETYIQFIRHCSGAKCRNMGQYCLTLDCENTEVIIFPQEKLELVKEW